MEVLIFKAFGANLSRDRRPGILMGTSVKWQGRYVNGQETKQIGETDARQVMSGSTWRLGGSRSDSR